MDICKSLNISIGTVMKNPEMLKFVLDHLKIIKMCKYAFKVLPYLLRYVSDKYKTQEMCDKAILENGATLKSVPECYKNQEMCNKAVNNYSHELQFVPECFMTQGMCCKAVNTCQCFMTQEYVMKQLTDAFLYLILFLIGIKLKKCVTELFLKIFF